MKKSIYGKIFIATMIITTLLMEADIIDGATDTLIVIASAILSLMLYMWSNRTKKDTILNSSHK
jgi:hypothetical protein